MMATNFTPLRSRVNPGSRPLANASTEVLPVALPVHMIKLTYTREITLYRRVNPDEER
jgi:hypothetical protein